MKKRNEPQIFGNFRGGGRRNFRDLKNLIGKKIFCENHKKTQKKLENIQ